MRYAVFMMMDLGLFTAEAYGIALVMLLLIGPAVGNYATSVVYRLPIGQTPFEKHPYCGGCGTMLTPKDLFPIFSYLNARGKCRYCRMEIPAIYLAVEVACGIIFATHFLAYGISEAFILATALGVFLVILSSLQFKQGKLYVQMLVPCFALAAMLRILQDGSIYPLVQGGFLMLVLGTLYWRARAYLRKQSITLNPQHTGYHVPDVAVLAALIGVCVPAAMIPVAILGAWFLNVSACWLKRDKSGFSAAATSIVILLILMQQALSASL